MLFVDLFVPTWLVSAAVYVGMHAYNAWNIAPHAILSLWQALGDMFLACLEARVSVLRHGSTSPMSSLRALGCSRSVERARALDSQRPRVPPSSML
ncbi:hypothetical protein PLICRDRAFT_58125 [Plicaturopsis crispa FD-325 SS-3]|uniref:Uncharacterized protein n=1 Tax=Plicaturopsis crispa FD-325 SS-3 TaxID=944288 RepID=A0A0C9SQQ9_PLICR|nr:hypothetical protein PLICRDRAFT_58125 [Plicaturopsis crispa FD-325 SS-3]